MFSKIKQHFSIEEDKLETLIKEVSGEDLSNLLFFLPKKYEFFLSTKNIKNEENKDVLIKLQIQSIDGIINKGAYNTRIGKKPVTISCIAENEFEVELVFFQISNVLLQKLKVNSLIICQGKLTINKTKVQIIHPKISHNLNNHKEDCIVQTINQFEMVQSVSTINKNKIIKINPVYHYIEGLYQYQIQNIIKKAIQIIQTEHQNELEQIDNAIEYINSFSQSFIEHKAKNHNFLDLIQIIHNTSSENLKNYHNAMEELSFIEIIIGQIALRLARLGIKDKEGIAITNINNENSMIKHVLNAMHFKLTEDQQSALDEIQNDQKSSKQMIRLLHGDVGSGKTIVAILAALGVVENGYQAFFLAPTAILAKQHHTTMQKVCFGLGLNIRLITGSTTAKERKTILSEIKLGQANIIIGTHALFNDKIEPHKVGLFIIDEQHNFGVQQRLSLINKCNNSDVLMMSATPIPRTVVMALYGDIKVSSIKTKPNGRQEIKTSVMNGQKIPTLVKDIEKRITENQDKVYWVCPLVEESEKKPYTNVNERYNFIKENINQEINIGLLHGKMKDSEKNQVMEEFKSSKTKVLVSTTVIEVGVDVPDANIIIIENAEKFGLAQLHQLRGRVGRGTKQSFCILLYGENLSLSGRQRLEIIKNNSDGFVIADYDFKMRGGGDIMGNEQSGFGSFKFASLTGNDSVIKECTEISRKIAQDTNNQTVKTIIELFNINSKYDMLST